MSGYVPTTGQVREAYIVNKGQWRQSAGRGFDAWLDQVKAEAFDEGWKARAEREPRVMNIRDYSAPPPPHGLNPYRNGEGRHVDQ